jgi:hypothetical protein
VHSSSSTMLHPPLVQVAKCGADELACEPDSVASQAYDQLLAACC